MFSNYMMAAVALVALAALGQTKPPKGEWPLPGHDNRHLAQAELPCDMASAPQEVWSYDIGSVPAGAALCADVDGDGEDEVIYGASPLVCKKLSGEELWRSGLGRVIAIADIDGDGRAELLTDSAVVVDGRTGGVLWSRTGPGGVAGRLQVAKLLPDVKGLQIATVSTDYGTMSKHAQVWSFANGFDAAELVWGRDFDTWEHSRIAVGAFDETRNCVISPTWGGFSAMDARDGTELMRLYWEGAPGISGLRQYTDQVITDLDGDGRSEYVVMATNIAQHLDMVALWRGSPGEHADKAKPVPAPDVPRTELAAYADGPLVWQRYFGTNYPTEDYLLRIPPTPIADVDGDGTQEVICTVGGQRWELKVYDGMTGAEKLSLPDAEAEAVFDLDGDGMPEIVARESGELVIGNLREGAWVERLRLPQCHMAYTERPIDPQLRAGPYSMEHRPVSVEVDGEPAWVGWKDTDGNGRADALVLLRATADGGLEVEERALPDDRYVSVLAGSGDRLIAVSADGQMHVLDPGLESTASWPCGTTFISEPVVADIDDDGVNEVLVYRAEQKAVALRAPADGESEPREVWSVDAGEPPTGMWHNTGGGLQTPLCADVNGDGKHEILITCRTAGGDQGARLLNWRGETIWETDIPFSTATFGDFNGDGHLDVYGAALTASERSVGKNGQSFALNGRDGSVLWHNDGSAEVVWHHHVGPSHRRATVFDVNGDGCDDVIFTALDLCGVLNGKDGTFLHEPVIADRIWEQQSETGVHWTAYGLSVPVDINGDGETEIFLTGSWGQWGAWSLDRELIWTFDPGKGNMARLAAGIGDVDGDGRLEFGVVHEDRVFRCYDAATGELRWEVPGVTQVTDVVTADVDGDGLPEFLTGLSAYKATGPTSGKLLWRVDTPVARSPVVADVDGDGLCEIIVACGDGKIRVYR